MTDAAPPPRATSEHPPVPQGRLWFGLLAAPVAWIVQGGFGWLAASRICTTMSIGSVRGLVAVLSLAMLAVAIAGAVVGYGNWSRSTTDAPDLQTLMGWERVEFMAACGFLLSAVFAIAIVWGGLGSAMLDRCGGMR